MVVAGGKTSGGNGHVRIYGLYGNYRGKIWNACAHDTITVSSLSLG